MTFCVAVKCRKCQRLVDKEADGCNRITCVCGWTYCFICDQKLAEERNDIHQAYGKFSYFSFFFFLFSFSFCSFHLFIYFFHIDHFQYEFYESGKEGCWVSDLVGHEIESKEAALNKRMKAMIGNFAKNLNIDQLRNLLSEDTQDM